MDMVARDIGLISRDPFQGKGSLETELKGGPTNKSAPAFSKIQGFEEPEPRGSVSLPNFFGNLCFSS